MMKASNSFRNLFIALIGNLIFFSCASAQPRQLSSTNRKAIQLFTEGRQNFEYKKNEEAYNLLKKATEEDDAFYEAHMLLADVCNDLKKNLEAIEHYKKAIGIKPENFPPVYYNLSGVEMDQELYEDAQVHLQKFLSFTKVNPELKTKAELRLASAKFAAYAIQHPVPFNPINLGNKINSEFSDYHPSLTVDEDLLIFTRMRPRDELTEVIGSPFEEDFYYSKRVNGEWLPAIPLGSPINTHRNEGAHSISPDGRYFFFTGCDRPDGIGSCDLYISERNGDKWSAPHNLGDIVNSGMWDAQPTLSADGQTLVFTSRRSGSKGMADLWVTYKRSNGRWSLPENLGDSINTVMDEFGPYLHPDGQTLYFSSAGHPGMGGKDIFYSKRKADGSWGKPVNMGYPINTKNEEMHMIVSADGKKGYFSSDREGGVGIRDIYSFELYDAAQPVPVTFMRGKVTDKKTGKPMRAAFEVIDLQTGVTRVNSSSDKVTGEFLVSLPSGSRYAVNVNAPGYLFYSGSYTLGKSLKPNEEFQVDIQLSPIAVGESMVLNNIFFASGSSALLNESKLELNKLVELFAANPKMKIEVGGHTDNVGNDQSNLALSEQRAKSVVAYLTEKGVTADRLTSKGYGKTKPIADNTSEDGRSKNRRTEFKVVAN
jgi:outer membrane protein OmpA-like peptidoglycan-associated protein/tetratricopeptide (TPR) repeat protein